jgi:hypothetical protein
MRISATSARVHRSVVAGLGPGYRRCRHRPRCRYPSSWPSGYRASRASRGTEYRASWTSTPTWRWARRWAWRWATLGRAVPRRSITRQQRAVMRSECAYVHDPLDSLSAQRGAASPPANSVDLKWNNTGGRGRYRTADRWHVNPSRAVQAVSAGVGMSSSTENSRRNVRAVMRCSCFSWHTGAQRGSGHCPPRRRTPRGASASWWSRWRCRR